MRAFFLCVCETKGEISAYIVSTYVGLLRYFFKFDCEVHHPEKMMFSFDCVYIFSRYIFRTSS